MIWRPRNSREGSGKHGADRRHARHSSSGPTGSSNFLGKIMGPMMKKQMRKRFEMVGAEVEAYLDAGKT